MNNSISLNNLNKTPVRTKEWLKVNDISITNYNIPEISSFDNFSIIAGDAKGVSVDKIVKGNILPLNKKFKYGVSEEIINQGELDFNQGYIITIKKGYKIEEPIVIEFALNAQNKALVDNLTVVSEEGSSANVIITYSSEDESSGYHNGLCKVFAKENSHVNLTKVNLLNKHTVNLDSNLSDISYGGKVDFMEINLGGSHSITNYHGDLKEDNSSSTLNSLYLGSDNSVIDINYIMTHKGRRSHSEIVTKGALKDNSNKIFRGTIDFKKGSSKSVGAEEEYCMVLSPTVKAKALPLLLCDEDDVSGEHAAASGKIDENKLFYLMSRGLTYKEARRVIIEGAFNPIIDKIDYKPLREKVLSSIKECLDNE